MTKALLKASILVDNDGNGSDIRAELVLFKVNKKEYEWRFGGEFGDVVEVLPAAELIKRAKSDFIATYPKNSAWKPKATWI